MAVAIDPTWKDIIVHRAATAFKPSQRTGAGFGQQFKLHGATGFLLHHDGA